MFDTKTAQEMAKQFIASLPPGIKSINQEVENHLREFFSTCFSKMDLVTKEEFEVQNQVLIKTRIKLEQLEASLKDLEEKMLNTK